MRLALPSGCLAAIACAGALAWASPAPAKTASRPVKDPQLAKLDRLSTTVVKAANAWSAHPSASEATKLQQAIHRGRHRLHLAIVTARREHPADATAAQAHQRRLSALELYESGLQQLAYMVQQTDRGQWLTAERRSAGALLLVQAARWELTNLPGARTPPVAATALVNTKAPAARASASQSFGLPLLGVLDRFHSDLRNFIAPPASTPAPAPATAPTNPSK